MKIPGTRSEINAIADFEEISRFLTEQYLPTIEQFFQFGNLGNSSASIPLRHLVYGEQNGSRWTTKDRG